MKTLTLADFSYSHAGMKRPECLICTRDAGLFAAYNGIGVKHFAPDGTTSLYGRQDGVSAEDFTPNGIALTNDGRLIVANIGLAGGVWQVDRSNDCRPLLMEVDGVALYPANFVLADGQGRLWISVSTRLKPRSLAYTPSADDGYIVLLDERGARIVADGLGYTNECRISNDGGHLYVNETFARRVSRFPIHADGSLGPREIFTTLGHGDFPDGGTFDAEGWYWMTSIISNRIYRVAPSGKAHLIFEDADHAYVERAESAFQNNALTSEILNAASGSAISHIASIAFGGPDLRTAYLGTLGMDKLPFFRSDTPGQVPAHWTWTF